MVERRIVEAFDLVMVLRNVEDPWIDGNSNEEVLRSNHVF